MDERADAHRVGERAHADCPAKDEADGENGQFDRGAHDTDRIAAPGQAGHQAVARAGTEPGADIQAGRGRVEPAYNRTSRTPREELADMSATVPCN